MKILTFLIDILCNTSDVLFVVVHMSYFEGKKEYSSMLIDMAQGKISYLGDQVGVSYIDSYI